MTHIGADAPVRPDRAKRVSCFYVGADAPVRPDRAKRVSCFYVGADAPVCPRPSEARELCHAFVFLRALRGYRILT